MRRKKENDEKRKRVLPRWAIMCSCLPFPLLKQILAPSLNWETLRPTWKQVAAVSKTLHRALFCLAQNTPLRELSLLPLKTQEWIQLELQSYKHPSWSSSFWRTQMLPLFISIPEQDVFAFGSPNVTSQAVVLPRKEPASLDSPHIPQSDDR